MVNDYVSLFREVILDLVWKIIGESPAVCEISLPAFGQGTQNDLIASPEDLDFLGVQPELLWQPDCLGAPGTKDSCCRHSISPPLVSVYTISIIREVCDNSEPALIVDKESTEQAVLLSLEDYRSLEETAYLLRSPANRAHLEEALQQVREGKTVAFPSFIPKGDRS